MDKDILKIDCTTVVVLRNTRTNKIYKDEVENQRQILESLATVKDQLNFSFQNDLKEEQDTYNYFLS